MPRIVIILNTPAAFDMWLAREAAEQLRSDPVLTCFMQHIGVFNIFLGLNAYLLRDSVLGDPKTARPFYLGMIVLHLALFYLACQAEEAGFAVRHGMTVPAGAVAAVFGGGAAAAWRFGPAPAPWVDTDDPPPPRESKKDK